jgi:hypothetical protein
LLQRFAQQDLVGPALGGAAANVFACGVGQGALGQRLGHRIAERCRPFKVQHQRLLHATQLFDRAFSEGT